MSRSKVKPDSQVFSPGQRMVNTWNGTNREFNRLGVKV